MSKVVHYEFMGSWLIFGLLFLSGIGMPFAILYLLEGIIRTDTEIANPEEFVAALRSGTLKRS